MGQGQASSASSDSTGLRQRPHSLASAGSLAQVAPTMPAQSHQGGAEVAAPTDTWALTVTAVLLSAIIAAILLRKVCQAAGMDVSLSSVFQ